MRPLLRLLRPTPRRRQYRRQTLTRMAKPAEVREVPTIRGRVFVVNILTGLGLLVIAARLFCLQILCHSEYSAEASQQQERRVTISSVRGPIVDREGRVLVRTLTCRTLVARPAQIEDPVAAAQALAPILGRPERELAGLLSRRDRLVELDSQVDGEEAASLRALRLRGIEIEEAGRRVKLVDYDLLGALNHEGRGDEGIECAMEEFLRGVDGWETRYTDANGVPTCRPGAPLKPAIHGDCVVLTIDSDLQWVVEEALARGVAAHRARGGSAVLVEVETGEVLALAGVGEKAPRPGRRVHRLTPIEDAFEPGSTFKLVTFAAALDLGLIDDDSAFFAENGRARFGSCEIRDVKKMGWLCTGDVLAQSSNIASAKIGEMVGARELYAASRRLGFGRKTHVELPGEEQGILRPVSQWSGRSVPTVAIGQEVAVTNLQLAMAYACVGAGGKLRRPRIVREVVGADGEVRFSTGPEVVRQAMTRETAAALTRYLVRVVEAGTGKRASIPGVLVAAKTGTAQKARRDGRGYAQDKYVSSFVGFFPADAPRYALAIAIDEPIGTHYGGEVAGPVFRQVAMAALGPGHRMEGLRTLEGDPLVDSGRLLLAVPDVRLMTAEAALETLAAAGFEASVTTAGERVLAQEPPPGILVPPRTMVTLGRAAMDEKAIPDLKGLSLREALRELRGVGVSARVDGVGRVAGQRPEAGTPVAPGLVCQLELATGESALPVASLAAGRRTERRPEPSLLAAAVGGHR